MEQQLHHAGEQAVILSPLDARERNIGEGMPVVVGNDRGQFEAVARIDEDVMPGVVVAPLGYWRRFTRSEATVQAVNSGAYADLGRAPTFSDNLVQVMPVAASQAAE